MALDDSTDVCKDKQNERNVNKYTYTYMSGSNIYVICTKFGIDRQEEKVCHRTTQKVGNRVDNK